MPLVLGSIVFKDYEIPEALRFGMKQAHVMHRLIGGTRVIDAMGPDDDDPHWAGRFQGPDASDRARALVALAGSGTQVPLVFGSFSYLVLVAHADCNFQRFYQIPYSVTCTVVRSGGGGGFSEAPASLDVIAAGDLATVASLISTFASAI